MVDWNHALYLLLGPASMVLAAVTVIVFTRERASDRKYCESSAALQAEQ